MQCFLFLFTCTHLKLQNKKNNYQRTPIECHIRGNVMQDNCSPQRAENGKQNDTFLLWFVKNKMSPYHKLGF